MLYRTHLGLLPALAVRRFRINNPMLRDKWAYQAKIKFLGSEVWINLNRRDIVTDKRIPIVFKFNLSLAK